MHGTFGNVLGLVFAHLLPGTIDRKTGWSDGVLRFFRRVFRGGGWNSFGRFARSADRRKDFGSRPAFIDSCDVGFRVAVSVVQESDD